MGHSHDVPARRNFLKLSARLAALGLTSLGVQPARQFFVRDVQGQGRVTDYKALVCVYMFGGNDANNLIVPADNYAAYSSARGGSAGVALAANTLLPIPGPGGATYGLHPSLTELVPIYNAGYLAFVLNMGALNRPLTKEQYRAGGSNPPNLFSHSDQTTQAQTASATQYTGWGGRLLDLFGATDSLSAVSVSSPAIFLDGADVRSNVIPPGANLGLYGMNFWPSSASDARRQAVNAMVLMDGGNPVREAANQMFADGLQLADTLSSSGGLPPGTSVFPSTSLGNQLREVARLIRVRSQMGPGRQGVLLLERWLRPSAQIGTHANLLRDLSQSCRRSPTQRWTWGWRATSPRSRSRSSTAPRRPTARAPDHAWGVARSCWRRVRAGFSAMPNFELSGPTMSPIEACGFRPSGPCSTVPRWASGLAHRRLSWPGRSRIWPTSRRRTWGSCALSSGGAR
jgi:uncharacterized protein (DUF1501 family)